ncbi:hypothetical protein D3C86_2065310 [compost metagenome]
MQQGVINQEAWMTPFLRANISDSNQLLSEKRSVKDHQFHIESMVKQYLENATL